MKTAAAIAAIILCLFCASAYAGNLPPGSSITAVDMGTLGGNESEALDINKNGIIIGESDTAAGNKHAFSWTQSKGMVDLGTLPGGKNSTAFHINANGMIVGTSDNAAGQTHTVVWENSIITDTGAFWGYDSDAAINSSGQVTGLDDQSRHLFLWSRKTGLIDLGQPPNAFFPWVRTMSVFINDKGTIVGICSIWIDGNCIFTLTPLDTDNDGKPDKWYSGGTDGINNLMKVTTMPSGFEGDDGAHLGGLNNSGIAACSWWENGPDTQPQPYRLDTNKDLPVTTALPVPSWGSGAWPFDINESGQVTGIVYKSLGAHNYEPHVVIWDKDGVVTDLTSIPVYYFQPNSINDLGQVVGEGYPSHALYADKKNLKIDLGTFGGKVSWANKINNSGWAVGSANIANGNKHAALWKIQIPFEIKIDVKPGAPKIIYGSIASDAYINVAVFSTEALDATTINPATALFSGAKAVSYFNKDMNKDGKADRVFKFRRADFKLPVGRSTATFSGKTKDGIMVWGKDTVTFIK